MRRRHSLQWSRVTAVLGFLAFTTAGTRTAAEPWYTTPPKLIQEAETNFRQGLRLMAQQKWEEAAGQLGRAWLINRTYDTSVNFGLVEERLGEYADAAQHISFALRHWPLVADKELK